MCRTEYVIGGQPSRSGSEFSLNRIIEIDITDGRVYFRALAAHRLQVRVHALRHHFFDLAKAEPRSQPSGYASRQVRAALSQISNDVQSGVDSIDRKAQGVRKIRVQH